MADHELAAEAMRPSMKEGQVRCSEFCYRHARLTHTRQLWVGICILLPKLCRYHEVDPFVLQQVDFFILWHSRAHECVTVIVYMQVCEGLWELGCRILDLLDDALRASLCTRVLQICSMPLLVKLASEGQGGVCHACRWHGCASEVKLGGGGWRHGALLL